MEIREVPIDHQLAAAEHDRLPVERRVELDLVARVRVGKRLPQRQHPIDRVHDVERRVHSQDRCVREGRPGHDVERSRGGTQQGVSVSVSSHCYFVSGAIPAGSESSTPAGLAP